MVDLSSDYFTDSSRSALRAVFSSFTLDACKWWLEDPYSGLGIELALEEESHKWFPVSNSSMEVRDKLLAACLRRGLYVKTKASVEGMKCVLRRIHTIQPDLSSPSNSQLSPNCTPSSHSLQVHGGSLGAVSA